jgi:DNA repair exonuclease SbcCD ATPase subunit
MKPTRLWAKAFGPYENVDWMIPEGVTAILGQNEAGEGISSNGAGKTMLLSILPLALWGPGSWADYLSAGSDGVCEVGCEFEHAGSVYRVRRTYNPAGRGKATLDLERWAA